MLFQILLLAAIVYISYRIAPREKQEDAHIHGAGQVGLLAAIALFGVDYFTSYFYATSEMMSALHLDHEKAFIDQYIASQPKPEPRLGGAPKETAPGDEKME